MFNEMSVSEDDIKRLAAIVVAVERWSLEECPGYRPFFQRLRMNNSKISEALKLPGIPNLYEMPKQETCADPTCMQPNNDKKPVSIQKDQNNSNFQPPMLSKRSQSLVPASGNLKKSPKKANRLATLDNTPKVQEVVLSELVSPLNRFQPAKTQQPRQDRSQFQTYRSSPLQRSQTAGPSVISENKGRIPLPKSHSIEDINEQYGQESGCNIS